MALDFKKTDKALYQPGAKPVLVDVPAMTFFAVAGSGDPNEPDGAYARALGALYTLSYTVKMSKKGPWQPEGYVDFVVPPLEGLWWAGAGAFDGRSISDKAALSWVSLIRQPDFVTPDVFDWACEQAIGKARKKGDEGVADLISSGGARLMRFAEGPCAQVMHRGPYDDEPATVAALAAFIESEGCACDIAAGGESPEGHSATAVFDGMRILDALDANGTVPAVRLHHEIYLGDPRRTKPENLRTVIRHPVRPMERSV